MPTKKILKPNICCHHKQVVQTDCFCDSLTNLTIPLLTVAEVKEDPDLQVVYFEPAHHTVMENVGTMHVTVRRAGGNLNTTVYVDYCTEDGSANAGSDYEASEG